MHIRPTLPVLFCLTERSARPGAVNYSGNYRQTSPFVPFTTSAFHLNLLCKVEPTIDNYQVTVSGKDDVAAGASDGA